MPRRKSRKKLKRLFAWLAEREAKKQAEKEDVVTGQESPDHDVQKDQVIAAEQNDDKYLYLLEEVLGTETTINQQPQTKGASVTQQPQTKEPALAQQPQANASTLTQQTRRTSMTQQPVTKKPTLTQQPQTNASTLTQQPQTKRTVLTQQHHTKEPTLTQQPQTIGTSIGLWLSGPKPKSGEKTCLLCQKVVTTRNYRSIFGEAVVELHPQIHQIFDLWPDEEVWSQKGLSNIVCSSCFPKLKKLGKIDEELSTRLQKLQEEKQSLIRTLQGKAKVSISLAHTPAHTSPIQPKSGGLKRKRKKKTNIPPKVMKLHLTKYVPIAPAVVPSELEIQRHVARYVPIAPASAQGLHRCLNPPTSSTSDGRALTLTTSDSIDMTPTTYDSCFPLNQEEDSLIQNSTGSSMDPVDTAKGIATNPSVQKWVVQDAGDAKYLKALADNTSALPGADPQNLVHIKCKEEPLWLAES
ncbi:uncharacterized protein [Branchiostoma lanceolatum]|uniref:uncharacterized protein isoform X1 n=1 Tax=Branchiostoma lanceolatum TaxID=7740 RepID=UPI003453F9F7